MSLIEAMVAMFVLTIGAAGMGSAFLYGMHAASSSENELIVTHKASEAVESIFSARDSHVIAWAQLRNASSGGIFLDGARQVTVAGADGVFGTADDGAVESIQLPGPDQILGTGDDRSQTLDSFTRQIAIADSGDNLRIVTVTITYPAGTLRRTYSVTVFISRFA